MCTLTRANTNDWKPTLRVITLTDFIIISRENIQLKMEYKVELDESMQRKRIHTDYLFKAYTLLCAKNIPKPLSKNRIWFGNTHKSNESSTRIQRRFSKLLRYNTQNINIIRCNKSMIQFKTKR